MSVCLSVCQIIRALHSVTSHRVRVSAGGGEPGDQFICICRYLYVLGWPTPHVQSQYIGNFSFFNSTGLGEFYDLLAIIVVSRANVLIKGRIAACRRSVRYAPLLRTTNLTGQNGNKAMYVCAGHRLSGPHTEQLQWHYASNCVQDTGCLDHTQSSCSHYVSNCVQDTGWLVHTLSSCSHYASNCVQYTGWLVHTLSSCSVIMCLIVCRTQVVWSTHWAAAVSLCV
jgi:hypothetical protein